MTKADLVAEVAEALKAEKEITRIMVEATIKTMCNALSKGHTLYIRGFGTLGPKLTKAKIARNISKNEAMPLPDRYKVKFKAARGLNNLINYNMIDNNGN